MIYIIKIPLTRDAGGGWLGGGGVELERERGRFLLEFQTLALNNLWGEGR